MYTVVHKNATLLSASLYFTQWYKFRPPGVTSNLFHLTTVSTNVDQLLQCFKKICLKNIWHKLICNITVIDLATSTMYCCYPTCGKFSLFLHYRSPC